MQVLVLACTLYIGLVDPIALVRRLEMRSAAFVQLRCIGLHTAPHTAGIHLDTTFGHQFGDVLVGERIPEIPAHAQNDHFSRVLAPFEWIVQVDRHGILPYQDVGSEVRNGTSSIPFRSSTLGLPPTSQMSFQSIVPSSRVPGSEAIRSPCLAESSP